MLAMCEMSLLDAGRIEDLDGLGKMTGAELLPIVRSAGETIAGQDTRLGEAISLTLADAWHGLIGDKVTGWRVKRAAQIQISVSEYLEAKGVVASIGSLPEHFALKWFDAATKSEESVEISDIFARLLVEAALGNSDALRVRLLDIVNHMTANDAKIFKSFVSTLLNGFDRGRVVDQVLVLDIDDNDELLQLQKASEGYVPGFDMHISFDILESLGLVRMRDPGALLKYPTLRWKFAGVNYGLPGPRSRLIKTNIELTMLGAALYNAISGESMANRLFSEADPPP